MTMKVKPRQLSPEQCAALTGAADRTHVRVVIPGSRKELLPEGAEVPETAYWMSRLRDGDVLRCDPTEQPPTTDSKPKARSKRGSTPAKTVQED